MKRYVGRSRSENLAWLVDEWLAKGPPVGFLQGFSGVGKTDLARDFRELAEKQQTTAQQPRWQQAVINEIADRATPSILESLMELSIILSGQGLPDMEAVLFEQKNPNLGHALEVALQRPVVLILDEAQRFFQGDSGSPLPEWRSVLAHLRNRPNLPGRLLLLSDRVVEQALWSEWIPRRTLAKLEPEEAIEALDAKLQEAGLEVEIPLARKQEVVRDLDFNPRAIEALVGALHHESLDEIIESNPGLWAVHDREVSPDFLRALERDLLGRAMRGLSEAHRRKLWRLAVHRRSFRREALEQLCGTKPDAAELRAALVSHFLLNFYKGALSLNPIAREIALTHLRAEPAEFRQAHSGAADYHLRHFKARQIVGSQAKLGESFAELRYHLVQAGRRDELAAIGQRFTDHLKQSIKSVSPVPTDREELDERIGVLTALLGKGGSKGLEYHLARCLQSRGSPGDLAEAVAHAERSIGPDAIEANWYLLASLRSQVEGPIAGVEVIRRALRIMPDPRLAAPLYQLGAGMLAGAGRADEAVALLREGIAVIPPEKNLYALYQLGAGMLAGAGRADEAVALLREGIAVIPPDQSLFSLYQLGGDVLAHAGRADEAVALLREGIAVIPPEKNLFALYQALGEVLCRSGELEAAIAVLREGHGRVPDQFNRYKVSEALLNLSLASGDEASLSATISATGAQQLSRQSAAVGRVLQCHLRGDWAAAAETARAARIEFPRLFALAILESFSRLAAGDAEGAWRVLSGLPNLTFSAGGPLGWLVAFIQLRRQVPAEAATALAAYLGRPLEASRELNESYLLRLWDQQEPAPEGHRLCFYFPILPGSLTGLGEPVRRLQFGPPLLPLPTAAGAVAPPPSAPAGPPEIYVSYAWGEDATENGRRREEIVDRLCAAVQATGRGLGRDKERMRHGDSIERFADEISRARRIVAVLSEKSLRSEFCMVHELFRAYRRCNYQRSEFQEKVIALVMDDARPFLRDHQALVALAQEWQVVLRDLRTPLEALDPTRKSRSTWEAVEMLEDMCPRLPDMLGALRDIVMKRGFDEIIRDNFREVIDRLPPREPAGS